MEWFQAFTKFALICLDDLAWPLFALGYPLRASIHAIETNSNSDTKKLVTYWVIFSLISLFEHAFLGMLQWLPFWPYMKLTIICWMMIPDFDGAFYVYNHFVHPCLSVDMETIIDCFNKFQDFVFKDRILVEADRYVMAHGPETLEKPIATESVGTHSSILQNDMKALPVTEKREVGLVNPIPDMESNAAKTVDDAIAVSEMKGEAGFVGPEIPSLQQVQKEWACAMCQVTTSSEITLDSHLQGRRHRDTCEEQMRAKNQLSKGKVSYDSLVNASQKQQASNDQVSASSVTKNAHLSSSNTSKTSKAVNPNTGTGKYNPQKISSQQKVGKKPQFRCTICNIYCGRSEYLNSHLSGKKHLARIQELNGLGVGELG